MEVRFFVLFEQKRKFRDAVRVKLELGGPRKVRTGMI